MKTNQLIKILLASVGLVLSVSGQELPNLIPPLSIAHTIEVFTVTPVNQSNNPQYQKQLNQYESKI